MDTYRIQDSGNFVKVQSICWLFCWAKTGLTSQDTNRAVAHVFDKSFDYVDAHINHEWARKIRYENMNKDFAEEFNRLLFA